VDSLTAQKSGFMPFVKVLTAYTGTVNIMLDPATKDFRLAQNAARNGIAVAAAAVQTGLMHDVDTLCGRTIAGDSGSYARITCAPFGYYELVTSTGWSGTSRYSDFLLLARHKPDQLHYGLTTMVGFGMCFQDSSVLYDTLALSGGYTYKNCTPSSKTSYNTPTVRFPSYNTFPFDTAVFNPRTDSIGAVLSQASLEPVQQSVVTISSPLSDTVLLINGSCLLLSTLSNVTIAASQTIMVGAQTDARYCRFLAHDFTFAGGRFENSMLYSVSPLLLATGAYVNAQIVCEDSIFCLPGADFTSPNVWVSRAHLRGNSRGGIYFKEPRTYSGTAISIKQTSDRDAWSAGITLEKGGAFTGYMVTDAKFFTQQVNLKGKFWVYEIQTMINYMTYVEYLFGIKLFYLSEVLPFPEVGQLKEGYIVVGQ
jgi:hypothetical protein